MTRTISAKLALLLAWMILVAVGLTGPAPLARAAGPELRVELTELRTTGSGDKAGVVLRGRVTNIGAQPAFGVRVVLWRSLDPIREAAVFDSLVSGANQPWGARLATSSDHYFRITASDVSFDPGATAEFTVRATLSQLGFTSKGTIYLLGAQVLGTADASSNYQVLTRSRTFFVNAPEKRMPLTSVVLLSAAPTKVSANVFASERLIDELSGRLNGLLELAGRGGYSWLVDPALIDEVTDLADGYTVVDGTQTRAGTGQAVAQQWLARFAALPADHGARTLFGNPDVLGAQQNKMKDVLSRSANAMAAVPSLADLPLVVLPLGGVADANTPRWLRPADADAILTSTAGRGPVVARGPAGSTLVRLAPDPAAAGPADYTGAVQRSQRRLAEALLGGGLTELITDPAKPAGSAPRWLQRTTLPALLDTRPSGATATMTSPPQPRTLPAARFKQAGALAADFAKYRELVPQSALADSESATLSRAISSGWLAEPSAASWLAAVNRSVGGAAIRDRVTLAASPRVLMSSRSNEFPVTISNRLSEPIRVRIDFSSDNPQRLAIRPTELVTVAPGQNQTVNVRPEASSNGLVNVTATIRTESGMAVGRPTRIAVEVTDLGVIGWIIVVVSGVVLVAATALRIRQVRRKQREEQS